MLRIALRTLRTRWIAFVGSFVALSLGVALIAVMGLALASSMDAPERRPERFAAASVVVPWPSGRACSSRCAGWWPLRGGPGGRRRPRRCARRPSIRGR